GTTIAAKTITSGPLWRLRHNTGNKYQVSGLLNPTYNIKKRGADVRAVAQRHNAQLARVAIQVIPECHVFWSYFGTIALIEENEERFSIPMRASDIPKYECLADQKTDAAISIEWSNGGVCRSRARQMNSITCT